MSIFIITNKFNCANQKSLAELIMIIQGRMNISNRALENLLVHSR